MKIKMFISAVSILILSICTNNSFGSDNKEYSFTQEYKVSSPLNLTVSTSGGNINALGQENNTAEISFIVTSKGKLLDITFDQLKTYADVEIVNDQSGLSIRVKKIFERNVTVGFSIKTPFLTSAILTTSGGNLDINGLKGNQSLKTSGGNISLSKMEGKVDASTSVGNISISNSSADYNATTSGGNISLDKIDGKLEVSTSGGNIEAEALSKGLLASTSGGNIQLNKIQGQIEVRTSGGEIDMNEISGSVIAKTSGGDVKANIVELKDHLNLETSGGSISAIIPSNLGLDLDLSADEINTQLIHFNGTNKKDKIKGQINGGGISVKLSTSSGTITLTFK